MGALKGARFIVPLQWKAKKAARQQHESRRYLESAWVSFLRGPGAT